MTVEETMTEKATVEAFAKLFYPRQLMTWMGVEMQKCPMDLLMYQEILWECRPDLIVECGTWKGGSALYLAHLCDIVNHGMVLTIDINRWAGFPQHPRIIYLTGSSVAPETMVHVKEFVDSFRRIMVILDSDHTKDHVLQELDLYSPLVSPRQYLIVEDTNIHGHPVRTDLPAGPFEAVLEWREKSPVSQDFIVDDDCERFLLTHNPGGFLRRVRGIPSLGVGIGLGEVQK